MEGVDTSNRKLYGITIVPCNIGDVVLVKGEKIIGIVSYKGTVDWDPRTQYIGLTLSDPVKNGHNGTARGHKYFQCADKHGLLIASHRVSRKIHGAELLHKVTSLNNAFKQCYTQSQELQQKYLQLRETLNRVEGDNQRLRQRLQYYEQAHTAHIPNGNNNAYMPETSPSPAPNRALSPSPSSRSRSKSTQKRRRFQKPLPPLPPTKATKSMPPSPLLATHMTAENEEDPKCYGLPTDLSISANAPKVAKLGNKRGRLKKKRRRVYRKRSNSISSGTYKSRKSSYKSRKSSYKSRKSSFKSRTTMTVSFKSRTTMTSNTRTADRLAHDSPMPLSIGDSMGGTIKMLIPHNIPSLNRSYSANTLDILNDTDMDESEPDYHDSNTNYSRTNTNYTNHFDDDKSNHGHYGQRVKFMPDDTELSALMFTEEGSLELGSCASTNMLPMDNMIIGDDVNVNVPQVINEDNEVEIDKHLVPHIVEEEYTSDDGDIANADDELSDFVDYEQMDEDSDLEIETPVAPLQEMIGIPMYQPQHKLSIIEPGLEKPVHADTHQSKPLPALVATQSKQSNNSSNKNTMTVHSIQYSGSVLSTDISIPDNIGLYATEQGDNRSSIRLLSDTQSSARYSNAPSYTYSNLTARTSNTMAPNIQKKPTHRKQLSHAPAGAVNMQQFNPMKKFSSVPAAHTAISLPLHDTDNGVFAARDILSNMHVMSDDNTSNNSMAKPRSLISTPNNIHVRYGQNANGNFHNITKRKSIGTIKKPKKMRKKRIIRSRTFVTSTNGQKYNVLQTAKQLDESTIIHQRECTPEIDSVEEKSYHPVSSQSTPITVPTTPQTMPLHALKPALTSLRLDDFALRHPAVHHKKYHSTHININERVPDGTPTISTAKSEQIGNEVFYRKRRKKNNVSDVNTQYSNVSDKSKSRKEMDSPHRNLGSLTHNELKGLLEADNLFSYDNYRKMVQ